MLDLKHSANLSRVSSTQTGIGAILKFNASKYDVA